MKHIVLQRSQRSIPTPHRRAVLPCLNADGPK
jgi:hypothetical protein